MKTKGIVLWIVVMIFLILPVCAAGDMSSDIIYSVATDEKIIAFTFDDGPSAVYTPQILDVLKRHEVVAIFFCMGRKVAKNPKILKRVAQEKHEIGNHTYTHPMMRKLSSSEIKKEIEKTQNIILDAAGIKTKLFRSPGGLCNQRILNIVRESNHQMILWSSDQDTLDWKRPGVRYIVRTVLKNANGGDIVLFHEINIQTVRALEVIIPVLKKRGYKFVTVSELIKRKVPCGKK